PELDVADDVVDELDSDFRSLVGDRRLAAVAGQEQAGVVLPLDEGVESLPVGGDGRPDDLPVLVFQDGGLEHPGSALLGGVLVGGLPRVANVVLDVVDAEQRHDVFMLPSGGPVQVLCHRWSLLVDRPLDYSAGPTRAHGHAANTVPWPCSAATLKLSLTRASS